MKRRYVALLPLLLVLTASPADAAAGDDGRDISWPQCSGTSTTTPPGSPLFGVVGVNGGRPYDTNTCLQAQATWAASLQRAPMLYANSANPFTASSGHWPVSGRTTPAHCVNSSNNADPGCAYDYGWDAANNALLVQAAAQNAIDPLTVTWWIDVEGAPGTAGPSWEPVGSANTADLQGMVDRLRSAGVPDVGVYTNGNDWPAITASTTLGTTSYHRTTSAKYRSAWAPYFTAKYPIEDGPMWFAGLNDQPAAVSRCSDGSLTGGEKLLSQYKITTADPIVNYDGDYRCADADHVAPTARMTSPAGIVVTTPTTTVAWTGNDTGGSGLASWDLHVRKAPYNASFGAWSTIASRLLTTAASSTSPVRGATTCWSARSRDAAGNLSAWSTGLCATTPLDDRDLSASAGWTRTTGASAWYAGSYSSSTKLGATLTRTGTQTSRLLLLAYRCPTCGSVTVLLNGSTLRTLSLASSTSGRAWISLPRFSLRTATITLKVATSGKLVRIDALATSRV